MLEISSAEVKRIREGLGITREELAVRLGVSPWTVRAWEFGQRPCNGPAALLLQRLDGEAPKEQPNAKD